jgi:hypothetical protein
MSKTCRNCMGAERDEDDNCEWCKATDVRYFGTRTWQQAVRVGLEKLCWTDKDIDDFIAYTERRMQEAP